MSDYEKKNDPIIKNNNNLKNEPYERFYLLNLVTFVYKIFLNHKLIMLIK